MIFELQRAAVIMLGVCEHPLESIADQLISNQNNSHNHNKSAMLTHILQICKLN